MTTVLPPASDAEDAGEDDSNTDFVFMTRAHLIDPEPPSNDENNDPQDNDDDFQPNPLVDPENPYVRYQRIPDVNEHTEYPLQDPRQPVWPGYERHSMLEYIDRNGEAQFYEPLYPNDRQYTINHQVLNDCSGCMQKGPSQYKHLICPDGAFTRRSTHQPARPPRQGLCSIGVDYALH